MFITSGTQKISVQQLGLFSFPVYFNFITLREVDRLRALENRVLRRIFEFKRDEVAGDGEICIKMNSVLCTLHQLLLGSLGKIRSEYKKPLGRPRRRLEDNIKMDLREICFGGWI